MNTNQQIEFTFKLAYTTKTKTYRFKPNLTITNFIETIKNQAYNDFDIYSGYDIEIVETGQYNNINGRNPEEAPALEPEFNTSLREKYGNINYNVAFYIRIITG
jgi:hypothetical protein